MICDFQPLIFCHINWVIYYRSYWMAQMANKFNENSFIDSNPVLIPGKTSFPSMTIPQITFDHRTGNDFSHKLHIKSTTKEKCSITVLNIQLTYFSFSIVLLKVMNNRQGKKWSCSSFSLLSLSFVTVLPHILPYFYFSFRKCLLSFFILLLQRLLLLRIIQFHYIPDSYL